jgi:hypothetical protein
MSGIFWLALYQDDGVSMIPTASSCLSRSSAEPTLGTRSRWEWTSIPYTISGPSVPLNTSAPLGYSWVASKQILIEFCTPCGFSRGIPKGIGLDGPGTLWCAGAVG